MRRRHYRGQSCIMSCMDMSQANQSIILAQRAVCAEYGAAFTPVRPDYKLGISREVRDGVLPVNGVRCVPEGDTTGWYVWAGTELSTADDFFQPLHVAHLQTLPRAIDIRKFLALPPGWRFLTDGVYEDAWFDADVLVARE